MAETNVPSHDAAASGPSRLLSRDRHTARCHFEDLAIELDHVQAMVGLIAQTEEIGSEMGAALRGVATTLCRLRDRASEQGEYFEALSA